jgi:hypothetical protein
MNRLHLSDCVTLRVFFAVCSKCCQPPIPVLLHRLQFCTRLKKKLKSFSLRLDVNSGSISYCTAYFYLRPYVLSFTGSIHIHRLLNNFVRTTNNACLPCCIKKQVWRKTIYLFGLSMPGVCFCGFKHKPHVRCAQL